MTVRARVTAVATLAVVIVLVLSGAILVHLQRATLTSNVDESLVRMSDGLIADARAGAVTPLHPHGDEDIVAQIVASDGAVLGGTSNLAGASRISRWAAPAKGTRVKRVASVTGHPVSHRLLVRRFTLPDGRVVTLYVGAPLDDVRDNINYLTRSMLAAVPVMAAILAALVWWLVGRTLRPVELIRARVASMSGTDIDQRVPEPRGTDEVARLAKTMNALLGRIEDATRRQRRFVADASHELRTPLTRMRTELEVDVAHPEQADAVRTQRSVLEEVTSLQQLVDDLLLLARSDEGAPPKQEQFDLSEVVLEETRVPRANGVAVDTSEVEPVTVAGDPEQIRRVVRNLLDNAERYARAEISITLSERANTVTVAVADDGPGIPPEQRERVFERFTRLDDSRATATGGTGLGLAIAREIVQRHGGTISVGANGDAGARFEVRLPRNR